jgi:hypothetical protein
MSPLRGRVIEDMTIDSNSSITEKPHRRVFGVRRTGGT